MSDFVFSTGPEIDPHDDSAPAAAQARAEHLAYWTRQLRGLEPVELPTDRPRPAVRSGRGASFTFAIPAELSSRLRGEFEQRAITPFAGYVSVFNILLANYTGQTDLCVGTPPAGGDRAGFEDVVGCFGNTLVLRTDLSDDPTVARLWERTRDLVLDAYRHRDLSFDDLVDRLSPERSLSRAPLFQHVFALGDAAGGGGWEPAGRRVGTSRPDSDVSRFDLRLDIDDSCGAGTFVYAADLFDRPSIERMAGHFLVLLEAIATDPDQPTSRLPMLTEGEVRQLLVDWNDTAATWPSQLCTHELITQQAARSPHATAVSFGGRQLQLTYWELEQRSNRIANWLIEAGVGPEVLVALCLERGPDMIAAVLGVLKAGGAYVPTAPDYPKERLDFILADTAAPVILTHAALAGKFPAVADRRVYCLDGAELDEYPTSNPGSRATADNLAYILYTSGSTGIPKGVQIQHGALSNLLHAMQDVLHTGPDDKLLAVTTTTFDISNLEMLQPLLHGAHIRIAGHDEVHSPETLAKILAEDGISLFQSTPSLWKTVLDEITRLDAPVRILLGGEALDARLVERTRDRLPHATAINGYGPTEAAIYTTTMNLDGHDRNSHVVPIGRPLANVELFVLDAHDRTVPVGVVGELYIGGAGLARGYHNRPELTAERFVHKRLGGRDRRLYRTGDLVRYLPDGNVEYLGRTDDQVKIRGFRIELGEIETALRACPQVAEAVVTARPDSHGDKRLVAYLVAADPIGGVDIPAVRARVRRGLPEYMVPSVFITIDAVPLTGNGKVDKRALPAPDGSRPELADAYVAPEGPVETAIAEIWSQVLGVDRVGARDNFFELGGHSLLATRVASRLRQDLGADAGLPSIFAAPTVAGLAALLGAAGAADGGGRIPAITVADRAEALPLSFAQQRLWFLDQLEPGSAQYLLPLTLRLHGDLDVAALTQGINALIDRHEALRTVFDQDGGTPHQIVRDAMQVTVDVLDYPDNPRQIAATALARMDLRRGPLLRATLFRRTAQEHLLVMTLHHIIADGWSFGVLARELKELYGAYRAGREAQLPELAVQYPDFAVWQREWLQGDVLDEQLVYWAQQLQGLEPVELPTDRPRPPVRSGVGASLTFQIPAELSADLHTVFRRHSITPFMGLLGVFDILLANYSGQHDLVVGTPVAGRNRTEIEDLVGFFVNTLVMRTDVGDDPTVSELWERVKGQALEAYAHQDLPFERLVERLAPERDLSRGPLFQHMFILQNAAGSHWELPGVRIEAEPFDAGIAKLDLTMEIEEDPAHNFVGALEYATDLFDHSTAQRMIDHFLMLLRAVADDPDRPISRLPMLTEGESRQLVVEWNDTAAPYPAEMCVHELVTQQAQQNPERIAVAFGERRMSYRELDERANQVAHWLIDAGVGAETLVGVCLDRGIDMIVGLLAILKAGGAYVPLDQDYPQDRLEFMLSDTGAPVVLTQQALAERIPTGSGRRVLCLDAGDVDAYPTGDPGPRATPDSLAYVIYTSGSTGTPKGVQIEHRAIVCLVSDFGYIQPRPDDVFLQMAPVAFDASTFEIWTALCNGARVAVAATNRGDISTLVHDVNALGVTVAWFTAGLFQLLAAEYAGEFTGLRQVLAGGDALPPAAVAAFRGNHPDITLVNGYGPTENTTFTCCADLTGWREGSAVAIGRPLANTEVFVLDAAGRVVPVGVAGELHIGGDGLARGYLNEPELTAEKFVELELGGRVRRVYRSGDLVRWLPNGELEFLGRSDNQVKVRGFRVELGEIETALRACPQVAESVVLARADDGPADKRLVAYLVAADPIGGVDIPAVRALLRERLPEYMVPSVFIAVDSVPLTRNGKVDKRALPVPDSVRPELADAYIAPEGPVQRAIAEIWSQVLGVDRVGAHDNFFDLGGHSLLATRVVSRLRQELRADVGVRAVFSAPTVAGLATLLEAVDADEGGRPIPAIGPADRVGPLPLSFAQQRLWFLEQLEPGSSQYLIPLALRLHGDLDVSGLTRSINALVSRHEALRTVFDQDAGTPVQVVHDTAQVTVDVLDYPDEAWQIAATALAPMDLRQGPLFRAALYRCAPQEHLLVMTLHHIIADGWSFGVLARELKELYGAYQAGRDAELPELAVQYPDFAVWQREWLRGDVLDEQLAYWTRQLQGLDPVELPTDRPRPAVQSGRGESLTFEVPADLSDRLRTMFQRYGITPFMGFLSVFNILLSNYGGQTELAVGTPVAGRNRAEIEDLVGFFVNTLVMRTDLGDDPTVAHLWERTRDQALEAYAHQDLPFERLVEHLAPERDLSRTPLFQHMFVLQNATADDWELPGLRIETETLDSVLAKFDLTLDIEEDHAHNFVGVLEYATDLFDHSTAQRMIDHFLILLSSVADDPDRPISRLPMLTEGESRQLVVEWNDTAAPYPDQMCVHELVTRQAQQNPERTAVAFGERRMSYRELDERANQVANWLIDAGVGAETLVGVCLDRGIDMIVGLLAVLKAGGAYVPLDPQYPRERLEFMLSDTGAPVVLTQQALAERIPAARFLCLDTGEADAYPTDDPGPRATPDNLAYVIYTSGSTGTPKGVEVQHGSLVMRLTGMAAAYSFTDQDVMLQLASIGFDSADQIFLPLISGGSTVLRGAELAVAQILESLTRHGGTVMELTPSLLSEVLHFAAQHGVPDHRLRLLIVGGEQLPADVVNRWNELFSVPMQNLYGPTETTLYATRHVLGADRLAAGAVVPIGRPLANTSVFVLDAAGRVVPVGVVGELYIGGLGLARGYHDRPELTAERFVHKRIGDRVRRLYRTGDLVRWSPDGNLEFLGRTDDQVKVRGLRVEPGEIETALRGCPQVAEAVVVARADTPGNARLVAYVVGSGADAAGTDLSGVRTLLRERLPEYLIPSAFVSLDAIPLTQHGKVDKRALPAPDGSRSELAGAYVAPEGPVQQAIAEIWSQVLGVDRIGAHDNFFELGGHSLLVMRVLNRVELLTGFRIGVKDFFLRPTVAALCEHLTEIFQQSRA